MYLKVLKFKTILYQPLSSCPSYAFLGHTGRIFSIALCTLSDGRKVAASASHDRTVRVWCLTTFTHMRTLTYSDFVWRVFIVINPSDGKAFIVAFISTEDKIQVIIGMMIIHAII